MHGCLWKTDHQTHFVLGGKHKESESIRGFRAVKPLSNDNSYPGINLRTCHRLDLAATLPLASAFRELLQTYPSTGKQAWAVDWKEAFRRTADELYRFGGVETGEPVTRFNCR